jgi:hypothetical protein
MATTTNYGWTTPDDTDLVKNGADAIRVLGSAIDTSMNTALGTKKSGLVLLNTTSFSAVASQSVNSVFTSSYANYRVMVDFVGSGDMDITCRLRTSGTDNSSATYSTRRVSLRESYITTASTTATSFHCAVGRATNKSSTIIDFFNPQVAVQTNAISIGQEPGSLGIIDVNGLTFRNTTQFDGFSLIASSGNITGTIRVYGYNN